MLQLHLFCTISARSSSAKAVLGSCRHRGAIWNLLASKTVARTVSSASTGGWTAYDCHHQSFSLRNCTLRPWGARQLGYCRQLSFSSVLGVAKEPLAGPATAVQTTVSSGEHYSQNVLDSLETSAYSKWAADATMQASISELPAQGDFTSLGLGGYSPIGLIQWSLEYLHVHAHLPWWVAIIASTLVLRTLLLPIAIHAQANAARLNNIRPETEKIMAKVQQYKQAGNQILSTQQLAKVYELYRKHDCHPGKMFLMPAMQVPIFISFFIAIRRMAAVPVESMKEGGILWFTDLTSPDPFFILPFLACFSFMAIMELGGEVGITNPQVEKMKFFFRCMSIVLIPVTAKFPAGLFMYWLTSSTFSMGQILLLRVSWFRTACGIPELIKHPPATKGNKEGEGFLSMVKKNYQSAVAVEQTKKRELEAKKAYEKIRKDPSPKLYDKPPHLRNRN